MIINGRPFTNENGWPDSSLLDGLDPYAVNRILNWIRRNIHPRKTVNPHHSSYGLKHLLQHDVGHYLTNNQFKDAMFRCGYRPEDPDALNWTYRINVGRQA